MLMIPEYIGGFDDLASAPLLEYYSAVDWLIGKVGKYRDVDFILHVLHLFF